ncbi:MAG TPA: alpha/beta hydrolase [Flavobacteriia bacterium]|jgi:hypothetical protein|nr:alpha/beta hydrolase [Flavobacteriia bacterium]
MEGKKLLYTAFTKLAVSVAVAHGMTLGEAKQLIVQKFDNHPYRKTIARLINNITPDKKHIDTLLEETIHICQDLGPDRDYVTLGMVLESIRNEKTKKAEKIKKDAAVQVVKKFMEEVIHINLHIPPPPLYNVLLEGRSLLEWTSMFCIYPLIPKRNKGHNKPVLLIPPYLGNDISTTFVRKYLKSLGFKTYKWDLGVNMVKSHYIPKLIEKLDAIYEKHQEKVSIVGWSGGGMFAKILANRYPDKVEQIITIGSPVWGLMELKTPLINVFEFFRGKSVKERNEKFLKELEEIPDVPITCIYTKTDGVVPWKHCMEAHTYRKNINNIEVFGSHSGMGANATVLLSVANSLSANIQGKEVKGITTHIESLLFPKFWKKNAASKLKKLFFKS